MATARRQGITVDDAELKRQLKNLEKTVAGNKVLRASIRAGALPIKQTAVRLAPERTGYLKKKIGIRSRKAFQWGYEAFVVAKAFYAHFVEFGVLPHYQGKRLRGKGRRIHPGHTAQPFLRPAFDDRKDDAVARVAAKLKQGIDKVTRGH